MTKILFVCLGNICRSPMAEFLMKALLQERGLDGEYTVASAAISSNECGNPVYPPIRALLEARGISCRGKTSVQLCEADYHAYDYIIGMDEENRRSMLRRFHGDPEHKVSLLLDYTDHPRSVADPWYTRDFHAAEHDIEEGCRALLDFLCNRP